MDNFYNKVYNENIASFVYGGSASKQLDRVGYLVVLHIFG